MRSFENYTILLFLAVFRLALSVRHKDDYSLMIDDEIRRMTNLDLYKDVIIHLVRLNPGSDAFTEYRDYFVMYNDDKTPLNFTDTPERHETRYKKLNCHHKTPLFQCLGARPIQSQVSEIYKQDSEQKLLFPLNYSVKVTYYKVESFTLVDFEDLYDSNSTILRRDNLLRFLGNYAENNFGAGALHVMILRICGNTTFNLNSEQIVLNGRSFILHFSAEGCEAWKLPQVLPSIINQTASYVDSSLKKDESFLQEVAKVFYDIMDKSLYFKGKKFKMVECFGGSRLQLFKEALNRFYEYAERSLTLWQINEQERARHLLLKSKSGLQTILSELNMTLLCGIDSNRSDRAARSLIDYLTDYIITLSVGGVCTFLLLRSYAKAYGTDSERKVV